MVGLRYDPMIAKLIAHGETREHALARLAGALDETVVLGVTTNLPFLRWLVRDDELRSGPVTTRFLEQRWHPSPAGEPSAEVLAAADAYAARERGRSPWSGRWRTGLPPVEQGLRVARGDDGSLHVWSDGRSYRVPRRMLGTVDELAHAPQAGGGEEHARLAAPMPGTVLQVDVKEGDEVRAGSQLLLLEAMKMEHPVTAPFDGTVTRVGAAAGALVQAGDVLVELVAS